MHLSSHKIILFCSSLLLLLLQEGKLPPNSTSMTDDRIARLEAIDFIWEDARLMQAARNRAAEETGQTTEASGWDHYYSLLKVCCGGWISIFFVPLKTPTEKSYVDFVFCLFSCYLGLSRSLWSRVPFESRSIPGQEARNVGEQPARHYAQDESRVDPSDLVQIVPGASGSLE